MLRLLLLTIWRPMTTDIEKFDCKLKLAETRSQSPSGRWYLQFQAVFVPDCCAQGGLVFAVWQCWENEPETHAAGRLAALNIGRKVMALFAAKLNPVPTESAVAA